MQKTKNEKIKIFEENVNLEVNGGCPMVFLNIV